MKLALVFLLLLSIAACESLPPDFGQRVFETVGTTAVIADRDGDGVLTTREAKDYGSNPLNWIGIIGSILGAAGVVGARQAAQQVGVVHKRVDKTKQEVDELYDRKADKAQ